MYDSRIRTIKGIGLKKLIRDNIVYILLVLVLWAITFPILFFYRDTIFSRFTYFWSPPGYKPGIAETLIGSGDAFLVPRNKAATQKFKEMLSADSPTPLPPLDLELMGRVCQFYEKRQHKDPFLDPPTWHQKKKMLGPMITGDREALLTFDPKAYWKENIDSVLQALDYYKRALNYSGPEIRVPDRIERVALAACRPAEIVLAYTTHIYQTEEFVVDTYLEKEFKNENQIRKPSWFRRTWNKLRGRKTISTELPLESKLSPKQIQLRVWDKIRSNQVTEISRTDFQRGILKSLHNQGNSLSESSPREALEMYERLAFLVANQNSPLEYRRYRRERGNIFLRMAAQDESYYKSAIQEFRDASRLANESSIPHEVLPAVLVENFSLELGIAQVYYRQGRFRECILTINELESKLRNIDERSAGTGLDLEKQNLLKEYRQLKKLALRKTGRYLEADEIPDSLF